MLAENGDTAQRPHALKVGFQSSMSEEHPTSPTKFMEAGSSSHNEDGLSSLDKSKIITYRPLKSVCDSENSPGVEVEGANLASDSDSGQQGDSKSSIRQVNSNLYRYVTSLGTHQIETFDQASTAIVNKNANSNLKKKNELSLKNYK